MKTPPPSSERTRTPGIDRSGSRFQTPLRLAAAAWFIGFTIYFFTQGLPNNSPWTRPDLWRESPWLLLDSVLPPVVDPGEASGPSSSGWRYLPQRFDKIWWASLVLMGSWHLGAMLLRTVLRTGNPHLAGSSREPSASPSAPLLANKTQSIAPAPPGLHFALAGLAGLSAWSLIVLGMGLAGVLNRWMFGGALLAFVAIEQLSELRRPWRPRVLSGATWHSIFNATPRLAAICLAGMSPFVLAMLLGALLPSTDFDVKAYHLVGPREWFQAGRITFLDHNVYTSFPFLTEMLLLSTMVLSGDWFTGGIAGQLVLASFGIDAAIVVFHLASRFSRPDGWLAALVYLTTPWVCRISIIAYVEGALAAYLAATLFCYLQSRSNHPASLRWTTLCGLFAGSAASCKYPGVISALIPFGLLMLFDGFRMTSGSRVRSALVGATVFSLAGLAAFGPWLLKNLAQTGNPVYPLLWGLFGGRAFDAELNAKFKAGHALPIEILKNPLRWIPDLWRHLVDVAVGSDWQSPLMFGLAPAAVLVWGSLRRSSRPQAEPSSPAAELRITILFGAWLFLTWWALTHRIDRFWVPMLSILAALSGITLHWIILGVAGAGRSAAEEAPGSLSNAPKRKNQLPHFAGSLASRPQAERPSTAPGALALILTATIAATTCYHLAFIASPFIGFNGYLMDDAVARRIAETPGMTIINSLPENSKTLLIGEAQVFEARRPVVYSTVFNSNVFENLFAAPTQPGQPKAMKPVGELRETLQRHGVTHMLVNWNEVLRYRATYGYTDFITPENVHQLESLGLIEPLPLRETQAPQRVADKPESTRFQLSTWGTALVRRDEQGEWYPAYELWRVVE